MTDAYAFIHEADDTTWDRCRSTAIYAVIKSLPVDSLARSAKDFKVSPDSLSWTIVRSGTLNNHSGIFNKFGLLTVEVVWFQPYINELASSINESLKNIKIKGKLGTLPVDSIIRKLPISGLIFEGIYINKGMRLELLEKYVPCILPEDGSEKDILTMLCNSPDQISKFASQWLARSIRLNHHKRWKLYSEEE